MNISVINCVRRLLPVVALVLLSAVSACAPHRQSGGLEQGFSVDGYTVDNGSGAAVTVADIRVRALNTQTGERDGPWNGAIHVLPGQSNGPVAINAAAAIVGAAINATGAVLGAQALGSCGGRGCPSSGSQIYVEGAFAQAGSQSGSSAVSGSRASIQSGGAPSAGGHASSGH